MKFKQPLILGKLLKRYKRFLADVTLENGETITVHCPNSGSMLGCNIPGSRVLLSTSPNKKRKYPHTLEMIEVAGGWVGINTSLTNHLVREALENGVVKKFGSIDTIRAEVKVSDKSRLDFLLTCGARKIFLEVKNCTLAENGVAMFPDAVTVRGTKHLEELAKIVRRGDGGAVLFCVQRADADRFSPAAHIDPVYAETLARVAGEGVLVLAYQAQLTAAEIRVNRPLPVEL